MQCGGRGAPPALARQPPPRHAAALTAQLLPSDTCHFRITTMPRLLGAMSSARELALLAALLLASSVQAGPLPSNVTITEGRPNSESNCAMGDVVYMSGDEFPGAEPCERCACAAGHVACARQECAPRPGCKAVHRPDHCCPTYQCECEQEGRIYDNGEKLVDPQDPCRVCYCQGGEVVCRRIACFVRDDCRPRLVPGRCCPEYDNCPLRGVNTSISMSPSNVAIEDVGTTAAPPPPPAKQEITIKEITPVSEIPVITDVKIKEILPSPSIEVVEYPSSKAPLIPREATSEKSVSEEEPLTPSPAPPTLTPELISSSTSKAVKTKSTDELYPSKISFSTQDAINSEIYPSNVPSISSPSFSAANPASSTKAPVIEEEDTSMFEHNPAFPPLPDDLSVLSNHEDEMAPETIDEHNEHVTVAHEIVTTVKAVVTEAPTTIPPTTAAPPSLTTTQAPVATTEAPTSRVKPDFLPTDNIAKTEMLPTKVSPMLNLRSALPTEILSVPSAVHEIITGDLDEDEASTVTTIEPTTAKTSTTTTTTTITTTTTTTPLPPKSEEPTTQTTKSPLADPTVPSSQGTTTLEVTELKAVTSANPAGPRETTSYIPKSDVATEVTSLTELSSLPVETSDQHPPAPADSDRPPSTAAPLAAPTSIKMAPAESEDITVSRVASEAQHFDNVETTEFILSSVGSSETTTDAVELLKISSDSDKSAAIIDSSNGKKGNVFTDLIKLVGDVATMSDSTEESHAPAPAPAPAGIADSEELIPVNAGYKSKNNNFNINSITESPSKSKPGAGKPQMELESEDEAGITDGGQRAEPTTRRAIIDRVDDATVPGAPPAPAADIEIITRSYVPTLGRRPTKVVQQPDLASSAELSTDDPLADEPAHAR